MKFHGFQGNREVCVRFYDIKHDNRQDGETWVSINKDNRVTLTEGMGCFIAYDSGEYVNGAPFKDVFNFVVTSVEFTLEVVNAHPKSLKFGKEQWQLVKVYGYNQ